ncbi:MAG: hypothetical protein KJ572_09220 [Gammaproteobacteria bacterium]|nr:hypothetical protein [Sideroxydans sp.]MBU3902853.1 hypothetical protein [Gammaproteobacteria bacterium]MBU4046514.1 hypothetical protein [Gammaproteobacteria bacterium]
MRELEIKAATTFPASPFALNAQSKNEISLGGFPPSKFTEHDFRPALMSGCGAVHPVIRIETKTGRAKRENGSKAH